MNGITFVPIDPKAEGIASACDRLLSLQPGILRGHMTIIGEILESCRSVGGLLKTSRLILGGESLKSARLKSFMDLLPSLVSITHNYSSTEALFISAFTERADRFPDMERIPVGYPLPGKDVTIVDDKGRPLPIGESGEIVVRSEFICSSIQGRDSHLRLEMDDSTGIRTYRTGDLGRLREDGMLEHLGRLDRQIKINGVRIDPLIIEQCIESHERVSSCIVTAVSHNGATMLAAAYVSSDGVGAESLRKHVNALLPASQQPQVFLCFDSLPRTDRGKPALAELEKMICERLVLMESVVGLPLSTPTERRVAELWSQVLGKKVQYRDDDFFRLGGHSLIALRLAARIHSEFGVSVPLADFFSDGRLESFSARVDAAVRENSGGKVDLSNQLHTASPHDVSNLMGVDPEEQGAVYPTNVFQTLMWQFHRKHPVSSNSLMPVMFRIHGDLDREALVQSFELLSESQPSFRTVFFELEGKIYQRVKPVLPAPFDLIESESSPLLESPEMQDFLFRPFDLEKGPMLRCRVVSHGRDYHVLQVVTHHIVSDAASMVQAFQEISDYYKALKSGRKPVPPVRGTSPGDLAREQRLFLESDEGAHGIRYWMDRLDLGGMDHPWPWTKVQDSTPSGEPPGVIEMSLDSDLSARIRSYSASQGTSFFRFMFGTYCLTLQGLLPGRAVTVDVPVTIRRTEEEFGLVGCLNNSLPITLGAPDCTSIEEYLADVGRQMDDAMRHARIPGYTAIEEWKRTRGIRHYVVPKTAFNFRENGLDHLSLSGTEVESVLIRRMNLPRDLILLMHRNSGADSDAPLHVRATFDRAQLGSPQVQALMDAWVSVMRHLTEGRSLVDVEVEGYVNRVYALAGGSGGFDWLASFSRLAEELGEGYRIHAMPDTETCFGRLPSVDVRQAAALHAERIMSRGVPKGKVWLLGEGVGGVDAFAVACELQKAGVKEVGLIIVDGEAPSASDRNDSSTPLAVGLYERMPERSIRLEESLFDLRLRPWVAGPLQRWHRLVPKSRRQVYKLALVCRLFDPAWYRKRYKSVVRSDEELFAGYVKDGWREGHLPSERFHAHRYMHAVEGFEQGYDEPVLHALLIGARCSRTRKEILRMSGEPVDMSDIVSVRSHLRMKVYTPGLFKGEVHLLLRREAHESGNDLGWGRLVAGDVYRQMIGEGWGVDKSTKQDVDAEVIRSILHGDTLNGTR